MAEVLLARTTDTGHHVVIKRIHPDQAQDHRFVQMFLDEARIASLLQHPNIVRVFDSGEDHSECFFAMEYVHGEDLRRVLMEVHKRRDQLPIALVTGLVAGTAAGLHHAHKQLGPDREPLGIVHRDVSPANILVGYDGSVKVADFGIAKAALRTVETRSGTLKGKVSYMSPEQVTGQPIDRRSDVFALGIVLYEVATARRLFKGDNDFLTMSAIVQGNIPRPSLYRPELPRVLEDIIMTALATAPGDRFQSAEELGTALAQFTASLGMRMSASSIADYMKKLFGARAEPWLVVDDEPTTTTTIDFDGSASGLVQTPQDHSLPQTLRSSASSPIAYAQAYATGAPMPQRAETEVPPARLAWMTEQTPIRPRSRRGRLLGITLGAVAAAAIGVVIIDQQSASTPDVPEAPTTVRMTASPPEPIAPEPSTEPQAPPAPAIAAKVEPASPAPKIVANPPPKVTAKLAATKQAPKIVRPATRLAVRTAPKVTPKPQKSVTSTVVVKKLDKKPPPPPAKTEPPPPAWDPNALFAPK